MGRETIDQIVRGGRIYQTMEEMTELMNESFRSVFSVEADFTEPYREVQQMGLEKVLVQKQEIGKLMEKLDVRKAMGPDGVSASTLKECREQVEEPIWNVINSLLKEGRVPREWKRSNRVPIYKEGNKTTTKL